MLPKMERLTKEDFKKNHPKIFYRGELFDASFLVLPSQKFACVISKKTIKRAVDRNKIKRRVFHGIQNSIKNKKIHTKNSFVFYPKKTSITKPYQQLSDEIKKVFDTLD